MARYELPQALGQNDLAYGGSWQVESQRIIAGPGARLRLHFYARNVYLVAGAKGRIRVLVEGKPLRTVAVTADKLYTLVEGKLRDATLELRFTPGLKAYAFTFG
jgi:Thioredoxin like C-terminal domain